MTAADDYAALPDVKPAKDDYSSLPDANDYSRLPDAKPQDGVTEAPAFQWSKTGTPITQDSNREPIARDDNSGDLAVINTLEGGLKALARIPEAIASIPAIVQNAIQGANYAIGTTKVPPNDFKMAEDKPLLEDEFYHPEIPTKQVMSMLGYGAEGQEIAGGYSKSILKQIAGLTSPKMLMAAPVAAEEGIAGNIMRTAFGESMVTAVPEAAAKAGTASVEGTPEERGAAYADLGATTLLPIAMVVHAAAANKAPLTAAALAESADKPKILMSQDDPTIPRTPAKDATDAELAARGAQVAQIVTQDPSRLQEHAAEIDEIHDEIQKRLKKNELESDRQREAEISARMKDIQDNHLDELLDADHPITKEHTALFGEMEDLKNKYEGQKPSDVTTEDESKQSLVINLSAATDKIPGLQKLKDEAKAGDASAGSLLSDIATDHIRHLLSGTDAEIEHSPTTGVYGGDYEPSVRLKVTFDQADEKHVMAALAKFSDNFEQEQIHVRGDAADGTGIEHDYGDGSYNTPAYRIKLNKPLTPVEVEKLSKDSGLYGMTMDGNLLEAYYVGDPRNESEINEFESNFRKAIASLGSDAQPHDFSLQRLRVYGKGKGAIPYGEISGDIRPAPGSANIIAQRIAARLAAREVKPEPAAPKMTPKQGRLQTKIAELYGKMRDMALGDPKVRRAYSELAAELVHQYKGLPIRVEFYPEKGAEPYKNSAEMRKDISDNNHLFIYRTTPDSFGPKGVDYTGHPLLEDSGFKDAKGNPMLVNDLLRAVHDYYAHTMTKAEFGPLGEEAAWKAHMSMTRSPWARWALTSETRGQNSYVNFGPDAEWNRTHKSETKYAPQKVDLLPVKYAMTGDKVMDAEMRQIAAEKTPKPASAQESTLGVNEGALGELGMGGAKAGEFTPSGQDFVSNMFAAIDKERKEMGKPPMPETKTRTWDEDNQRALATMNRDPNWIPNLIREVTDNPRPLLSWENAGLVWQRNFWKAEANNALMRINRAFEDGRDGDLVQAKIDAARFEDNLDALDKAVGRNGTGSEAGRSLQAQKMAAGEDFTLVEMRMKKRAAQEGRPLTPEQEKEVSDAHAEIEKTQKALDEHEAQKQQKASEAEVDKKVEEIKAQPKETPEIPSYIIKVAEKIISRLDKRADAARARIKERMGRTSAGIDPTVLLDLADIGASHLGHVGLDFAKWSTKMVDEFGDFVKPHLQEVFDASKKIVDKEADAIPNKRTGDKVKRAVKQMDVNERLDVTKKRIAEKVKEGKSKEISVDAQKLARIFIEQGVKGRDAIVDAVHGVLKESMPDITRRDTMDAISGYGDFKQLSKDAISVELRDIKGQLQNVAKLEDIEGRVPPQKTGVERRVPSDEERRLIKLVNEAKRKYGIVVTDTETQLTSALQARKTYYKNQIADLQAQIDAKEKTIKSKSPSPTDPELEALKVKRNEVKAEFDKQFNTESERQASNLAALKTRLAKRTKELQDKLAAGDFTTKPRIPTKLDEEAMKLKAENERAKTEFRRGLLADQMKNRTGFEKMADGLAKWRRFSILSGPATLAKLTGAAILRLGITPIEEGIGAGISKVIPDVADKAPRHGGGSLAVEIKALTQGLMKGIDDAGKTLKTGSSDLDMLFGREKLQAKSWLDIAGNIHGMLKAPVKRVEFERSLEKRMQQAAAHGIDVTDPLVQTSLMGKAMIEAMKESAYTDAQRAIFMQDNRVVAAYKAWLSGLERADKLDKKTGRVPIGSKTLATASKILLPIVKVPTNIAAETMEYATGAATGSGRLSSSVWNQIKTDKTGFIASNLDKLWKTATGNAELGQAYSDAMKSLSAEEADLIMRNLKKGLLGNAVMLLGFFAPQMFGGYYQRGEKRPEGDLKYGEVKIAGHTIPSMYVHNPTVDVGHLGSTTARVSDSKLNKKDLEKQGIGSGIMAGLMGVGGEVPFIREMAEISKTLDPSSRGAFWGELAKTTLVPKLSDWIAQQTDTNAKGEVIKRKPNSVMQHIETSIPGLRKNVPEAKK